MPRTQPAKVTRPPATPAPSTDRPASEVVKPAPVAVQAGFDGPAMPSVAALAGARAVAGARSGSWTATEKGAAAELAEAISAAEKELASLRVSGLRRRAAEAGVASQQIDSAFDHPNGARDALIALILHREHDVHPHTRTTAGPSCSASKHVAPPHRRQVTAGMCATPVARGGAPAIVCSAPPSPAEMAVRRWATSSATRGLDSTRGHLHPAKTEFPFVPWSTRTQALRVYALLRRASGRRSGGGRLGWRRPRPPRCQWVR
jgi:hypothetical protein